MCSNTRLITLHSGSFSVSFNNVYMTEAKTEATSTTGTIQKKRFVLYLFRHNSSTPLEDIDWNVFNKSEAYAVDEDNPDKKLHITFFKKCLYGSYNMHHIEMEME